ncbi:MAG: hypothetical protein K9L02_00575 [Acholeplasmataceae bacterium]|nr:hypothetical protein [Acholeplasmataceae bacterium]
MKRLTHFLFTIISLLVIIILSSTTQNIFAADDTITYDAVYFASHWCSDCQGLEDDGVIEMLENQGYLVLIYYLEDDENIPQLLSDYQYTYDFPLSEAQVPVLFVGSTYFAGRTAIREGVLNNEIQQIMDTESLLPLESSIPSSFSLVYFILLGIVDGINPCAIAMLLLFISLLRFTKNKRILIGVSLTFISAIFISYFSFGTFLYQFMDQFNSGSFIVRAIPWIIAAIALFLFFLNMYDFFITSSKRYDKVKNQLPKGIQKFNKKLMAAFTKHMDEGSWSLYLITFVIGLVISLTEFLCTGQAYLTAILTLIHSTEYVGRGVILLLFYNLIFVLPLIIISLIAVLSQSITPIAAFMRERLNLIKLFSALVFFAIFVYYLFFVILVK